MTIGEWVVSMTMEGCVLRMTWVVSMTMEECVVRMSMEDATQSMR